MQAIMPGLTQMGDQDNMSEDCLFLNVYSPNLTPRRALPVMVFIHGGAFTIGNIKYVTLGHICKHYLF